MAIFIHFYYTGSKKALKPSSEVSSTITNLSPKISLSTQFTTSFSPRTTHYQNTSEITCPKVSSYTINRPGDSSHARQFIRRGSPIDDKHNRPKNDSSKMDPITTALVVVFLGILAYYFFWISSRSFDERGIEYTKPWPFVGNMAPVLFRTQFMGDYVRNIYFKFRDLKYFGFFNLVSPIIVIRDPDLITSITVKNFDHFTDHIGLASAEVDPLFGKNLVALRGDHWRNMRKLLSPAFTSAKLKTMFTLINDCAERTTAFIVEKSKNGRVWDIQDVFRRYTNDVIATSSFGIAVDSLKDPDNEFYKLGSVTLTVSTLKFMFIRHFPTLFKLLGITLFGERTRKFFTNVVAETTRMREEKGIHRPDMIQLMMDSRDKNGNRLSVDEMTSQAFIFFAAGFETTSTMMCLVVQMIANNPEVRSKLLLEVEEAHRKISEGQSTYDVIRDMAYLDAVIDETLRMYPIAQFLDRACVKEFELPPAKPGAKPVKVKPGDSIWFIPSGLHYDPKYYKDPENFRPERFLNGEVQPNAYMPFGLGPRSCIGNRFAIMESKILFYHLLKSCVLNPSEKTTVPLKFTAKSIRLTPVNGYWLNIKSKKNESVTNGHVDNGKAN